ncbi:hypothetical protein [Aeromonas sanarellii]|uniref:ParE family toxin-like protein n=1 Tax=Aeromonas sanarellii TaxID=633415 RepID=UPI003BA27F82
MIPIVDRGLIAALGAPFLHITRHKSVPDPVMEKARELLQRPANWRRLNRTRQISIQIGLHYRLLQQCDTQFIPMSHEAYNREVSNAR